MVYIICIECINYAVYLHRFLRTCAMHISYGYIIDISWLCRSGSIVVCITDPDMNKPVIHKAAVPGGIENAIDQNIVELDAVCI